VLGEVYDWGYVTACLRCLDSVHIVLLIFFLFFPFPFLAWLWMAVV
jgi:hypothetical protein